MFNQWSAYIFIIVYRNIPQSIYCSRLTYLPSCLGYFHNMNFKVNRVDLVFGKLPGFIFKQLNVQKRTETAVTWSQTTERIFSSLSVQQMKVTFACDKCSKHRDGLGPLLKERGAEIFSRLIIKGLSQDVGQVIFLKTFLASLFYKCIWNEPNFGLIHLAGLYL